LPKIGEAENEGSRGRRSGNSAGRTFKHNKTVAPKPLHKLNNDYERKMRVTRKKTAGDGTDARPPPLAAKKGGKMGGRYGGKSMGRVKTELKTAEQIRKGRKTLEKRKAKNARPNRSKKSRR
jgi:ATP-dependent RNA helicase DDX54/DBP10